MLKNLIAKLDKRMHYGEIYCNTCKKWVEPLEGLTKQACPECLTIVDNVFSKRFTRRISLETPIAYDFKVGSDDEIYILDGSTMDMQCPFFTEEIDGLGIRVKWYFVSAKRIVFSDIVFRTAHCSPDIEIVGKAYVDVGNGTTKTVTQKFIIEEKGNFVHNSLNEQYNECIKKEDRMSWDAFNQIIVMDGRCHPKWFGEKEKKLLVHLYKEENGKMYFKVLDKFPEEYLTNDGVVWKKKYANFHKAVYKTKREDTHYGTLMDYNMIEYIPFLIPSTSKIVVAEEKDIMEEVSTKVNLIICDADSFKDFQAKHQTERDTSTKPKWSGGMFIQEDEK